MGKELPIGYQIDATETRDTGIPQYASKYPSADLILPHYNLTRARRSCMTVIEYPGEL